MTKEEILTTEWPTSSIWEFDWSPRFCGIDDGSCLKECCACAPSLSASSETRHMDVHQSTLVRENINLNHKKEKDTIKSIKRSNPISFRNYTFVKLTWQIDRLDPSHCFQISTLINRLISLDRIMQPDNHSIYNFAQLQIHDTQPVFGPILLM